MIKCLTSKIAAQLDAELMSTSAFSIDQLMELAGLAVAQAVYSKYPPGKVVMLIGPGNNGGDGLVAARHLKLWGHLPTLYYPKKLTKLELYSNLLQQCRDLDIKELDSLAQAKLEIESSSLVIDALFGFLFKPPLREPFGELIQYLNSSKTPVASVDIPLGWDVDDGPQESALKPDMLVSLTAPKPCSRFFSGTHYLGGRFISPKISSKYGLEEVVDLYKGLDLIVDITTKRPSL